MPRGGRRKKHDGLASIPQEILHEILVRLPAKSVLRCRAVCREWRRLTSDPAFLVAHHRHQPTLHLISSFRSVDRLFSDRLDAVDLLSGERQPVANCMFDASCDGLVVIGSRIYNPATRQWASLGPKVRVQNLVGLFRHQPSGEYRVLFWRISRIRSQIYCPNEYCVLTVGSVDDPRPIRSPAPVPVERKQMNSSEPTYVDTAVIQGQPVELELINAIGPTFIGAPVLLHGNMYLHWKKYWEDRRHKVLVFDTVAESFWHLRPPPVNPRHIMQLFDMDGNLAASSSKDTMIEMRIFLLQKESDIWAFQYRIKLPEMEIRQFQEQGDWLAKVVSEEGDLLVACFGWLLHCDRKGKLVAKFRFDDDLPVVVPHVLKESLIQHKFFLKD
ncbi:hypothetical protein QOZ80_4AG0325830 [Eleusine coracana subsp. coracana]|nr:hypothetical protein QOZ80_4AG0325830 [Eleusine coracana subsp. coracana]